MDELYLQLVQRGNAAKFSYFIDKYQNLAYTVAYRIVANKEDAEEIVQDAFLKAFRSLDKFRRDAKFSTWFYRIVVNSALTHVRSQRPESVSIDADDTIEVTPEEVETAFHGMAVLEQQKFIQYAFDKLPVEARLLLTLFYLNEQSIAEISEITGIAGENVKMKLHRARNKMYTILQTYLQSEVRSIL
jgi:RNA polymerase sigma factor (sigma-70 family)